MSWKHASYAPALPMPPPPILVGPTLRTPPLLAPPSESDWNFSSGQSQALRAQYVPPGEFASLDFNDWGTEEGGVGRSLNDSNNHAVLVEHFQSSMLHKLQKLGLYTKMNTPNTANQLDAEAVAAEVTYIITNRQPSCSGGGDLDHVPNIFKEAMDLPQGAR